MFKVEYSILILLQFFCYCSYAQNSSKIILGNTFDYPSEILSTKNFDSTADIITAVKSDIEAPKSRLQPISIAPSTSSKRHIGDDRLGLYGSVGYGIGYSSHAASYSFDDGLRIKSFSGFRSIVLDTKLGWRFHKNIAIFGTWKFAPGNATISPYRSNYLGGGLALYFGDSEQFSIHGGLGKYQAKVGRNEVFGNGLLINYGTLIKLSNNFGLELNVLSGKINSDNANPVIVDSMEFNFTAGVAFLF